MKNITLAIDDDVLEQVRVVAAERRTTVNALVRAFLGDIAKRHERASPDAGHQPARAAQRRSRVEPALREVEATLFRGAESVANPSHLAKLEVAARRDSDYESAREVLYDRERARAEAYLDARASLLRMVDDPKGDLGSEGWNRTRLYEP